MNETIFISEDTHLAIKQGAVWLDEQNPDWAARIDLESLDLQDCAECILGQLYGHYSDALDWGQFDTEEDQMEWSSEHGFAVPVSEWAGKDEIYRPLTLAWTNYIMERL